MKSDVAKARINWMRALNPVPDGAHWAIITSSLDMVVVA